MHACIYFSLQEALQIFRPDFILRSQRRVHRLEQRARERRGLQPADTRMLLQTTTRKQISTKPHPLSGMTPAVGESLLK